MKMTRRDLCFAAVASALGGMAEATADIRRTPRVSVPEGYEDRGTRPLPIMVRGPVFHWKVVGGNPRNPLHIPAQSWEEFYHWWNLPEGGVKDRRMVAGSLPAWLQPYYLEKVLPALEEPVLLAMQNGYPERCPMPLREQISQNLLRYNVPYGTQFQGMTYGRKAGYRTVDNVRFEAQNHTEAFRVVRDDIVLKDVEDENGRRILHGEWGLTTVAWCGNLGLERPRVYITTVVRVPKEVPLPAPTPLPVFPELKVNNEAKAEAQAKANANAVGKGGNSKVVINAPEYRRQYVPGAQPQFRESYYEAGSLRVLPTFNVKNSNVQSQQQQQSQEQQQQQEVGPITNTNVVVGNQEVNVSTGVAG